MLQLAEAPPVPYRPKGGHVRIFHEPDLRKSISDLGFAYRGKHYAHALHSPYWWLKCAVGVGNDKHPLVQAYHRLLQIFWRGRRSWFREFHALDDVSFDNANNNAAICNTCTSYLYGVDLQNMNVMYKFPETMGLV